MFARPASIRLPSRLQSLVEASAMSFLDMGPAAKFDFTNPVGEPALAPPDSVSWQVFRNPVSLFIGGVAAVILELGEPKVRSGVWGHSSFSTDPIGRLKRTGLAAMVTVYGARSNAERMIAGVRRAHDKVTGVTPSGEAYAANDPDLLSWVQATAQFGFLEAYHRYVRPLPLAERDRYHAEGRPAALLYGSVDSPASEAELHACFGAMRSRLECSPIIDRFLAIMRTAPLLPLPARPIQRSLVRAAIDILPSQLRQRLGLGARAGLRPGEAMLVRRLARFAEQLRLDSSPAAQASVRLGLPPDYLHSSALRAAQRG